MLWTYPLPWRALENPCLRRLLLTSFSLSGPSDLPISGAPDVSGAWVLASLEQFTSQKASPGGGLPGARRLRWCSGGPACVPSAESRVPLSSGRTGVCPLSGQRPGTRSVYRLLLGEHTFHRRVRVSGGGGGSEGCGGVGTTWQALSWPSLPRPAPGLSVSDCVPSRAPEYTWSRLVARPSGVVWLDAASLHPSP